MSGEGRGRERGKPTGQRSDHEWDRGGEEGGRRREDKKLKRSDVAENRLRPRLLMDSPTHTDIDGLGEPA